MSKNESCALYLRSSKDRHEVSIPSQRVELLALAAKHGLTPVAEYADAVERADDWQRPGFASLLRDIEHGKPTWRTLLVMDAARLARSDEYLAAYFRYQCQKRGVRIIFQKFPSVNPMQDLMVQTMDQLFSKVHSMISREKGLAGMAENVRLGYRAGGAAPYGYNLDQVKTGGVRDGAAVTKSRLVPNVDAPSIAAYLKMRAKGAPARQAARAAGVKLSTSSLVDAEWRAMTYAGHTVWNQTRTRGVGAGGYVDGAKRRPRAEWLIKRDTHEALISEEAAELVLRHREGTKTMRMRGDAYLLSGLLVDHAGRRWHGDQGFYRCGRRRLSAKRLERMVIETIGRALRDEAIVKQAAAKAREAASATTLDAELRALRRQADDLARKIGRVRNVMTTMEKPEAMAPKLVELAEKKQTLDEQMAAMASQVADNRVMRMITEEDVRAVLGNIVEHLAALDRTDLKVSLRTLLAKIVVNPDDLTAEIHYAIPAATGVSVASPRPAARIPAIRITRRLELHGFRRAA